MWNKKNRAKSSSAKMSESDAISTENDGISRNSSGHRIGARFDNCVSMEVDQILDLVNGDAFHLKLQSDLRTLSGSVLIFFPVLQDQLLEDQLLAH
jgi:hypothetical protein